MLCCSLFLKSLCLCLCLCDYLLSLSISIVDDLVTLLLCTEKCILESILVLHVLAYLFSQDLYLVIALCTLALHFVKLRLELREEFVDLLLFIAECSLFKSFISDVL